MIYMHVERYLPRPSGLALVSVCRPPDYVRDEIVVRADQLIKLYRLIRKQGPVTVWLHQTQNTAWLRAQAFGLE